ncbi:MAG: hypothetical protein HY928_14725 [Elusimicrobia bacterium]|nr:hypothetical protein [Elusimicrobiota bacterium]
MAAGSSDDALASLIRALKGDKGVAEGAPPAPSPAPAPAPAPPAAASQSPPAAGLETFLMRRLEGLEGQLRDERARASAAEARMAEQDAARAEADAELRRTLDAMRQVQAESHSRGRVEALESRLDAMHQAMMEMLRRIEAGRAEARPGADPAARAVQDLVLPLLERLSLRISELAPRVEATHGDQKRALTELAEARKDAESAFEALRQEARSREDRLFTLSVQARRESKEAMAVVREVTAALAEAVAGFAREAGEARAGWEKARLALDQAREAAEAASRTLASLAPRGAALEQSAALLAKIETVESSLAEAGRRLAEKDAAVARLSRLLGERLK